VRLLLATAVTATVAVGVYAFQQQQGPGSDDFCEQLAVVEDLDETLATLDPVAVSGVTTQLQSLYDVSPDGVRGNVGVLLAFTDDLVAVVADSPGQEERAVETVAAYADLDTIAAAGVAVERYAADECGIGLSDTTPTTAPAPPPTPSTDTTEP